MEQHRFAGNSVNRVTDNGHAKPFGGMNPDLVCSAGFRDEANQRASFVFGDQLPGSDRTFTSFGIHHDPPTVFFGAAFGERQVDHT